MSELNAPIKYTRLLPMVTENTISENGGGNADDKGAKEFGPSKRDSLRNSGQRTKKP